MSLRQIWSVLFCVGVLGSAAVSVAQRRTEPWHNDVAVFSVDPSGKAHQLSRFPRAGVSSLARLTDGRVVAAYQTFPNGRTDPDFDRVAVRFSADDGQSWSDPEPIRLPGWPADMRAPFDPTLVTLPDGRVRLYFTSHPGRGPAAAPPAIYSAVSTNGIDYEPDPGVRFHIAGKPVIDCAVVRHQGVFHLFAPADDVDPRGYHATSSDGLSFTRQPDLRLEGARWLGAVHSDGLLMTFVGTAISGALWTATSGDGQVWTERNRLQVPGADPGAVLRRGGDWLVSVTVPPALDASPVR